MEDMGFFVTFKKGKLLIHLEGFIPNTTMSFGDREGKLYRLKGKLVQMALVHENENMCELWNMSTGHLHYKEFPILRDISTGLPHFNVE
jgi:hypothetical protein